MALYDSENNKLLDTNDNVLEARVAGLLGDKTIQKQYIGSQEVKAIYIGNNLVYEKVETLPQLSAPVISLSGDTLSIEEVENAEYYDIYVDGVLEESVDARGYKEVTVTNTLRRTTGHLYDGQDNTGIDLGTLSAGETKTFHIESGYIYIKSGNHVFSSSQEGGFDLSNPYEITSNVTLYTRTSGSGW